MRVREAILAHQGGWDEFLLVATPIALFVLLLRAANRRAGDGEHGEHHHPEEP